MVICVESKPRGEERDLVGPIDNRGDITSHGFPTPDRLWCLGYKARYVVSVGSVASDQPPPQLTEGGKKKNILRAVWSRDPGGR